MLPLTAKSSNAMLIPLCLWPGLVSSGCYANTIGFVCALWTIFGKLTSSNINLRGSHHRQLPAQPGRHHSAPSPPHHHRTPLYASQPTTDCGHSTSGHDQSTSGPPDTNVFRQHCRYHLGESDVKQDQQQQQQQSINIVLLSWIGDLRVNSAVIFQRLEG